MTDIGLLILADTVVGISFGAIAAGFGLPAWVPVLTSLAVFAGSAQFAAVALLAGGSPVAALLAGLLLNARHLPYGLAVADLLGDSWGARALSAYVMIDESVAFGLAQPDRRAGRAALLLCGAGLFLTWNLGTVLGYYAGHAVGNPNTFGLDAAFPAVLLALIMPALRDGPTRGAALLGSAVGLMCVPFLAAGIPVLLSLTGLVSALRSALRPSTEA
ncbi:MAG: AzlC family ABC transporter permease [Sciscionella sp.]